MTENILRAMVGWSVLHDHHDFALTLPVGFYSLLRLGSCSPSRRGTCICLQVFNPQLLAWAIPKQVSGKVQLRASP
jgi:hypothetical protein